MRTILSTSCATLAAAALCPAAIEHVSDERVISTSIVAISGLGDSQTAGDTRTPAGAFQNFADEIWSEAWATLASGTAYAVQDSRIDGERIVAFGEAWVTAQTATLDDPIWGRVCGEAASNARSRFRMTFRITEPGFYLIGGSNGNNVTAYVLDSSGVPIFSAGQADQYWGRLHLFPGEYTIDVAAEAHAHMEMCTDGQAEGSQYYQLTFDEAPCPADMNADGLLNVFDFLAFQTAFGELSPAADLAEPIGVFNVFDFLSFQQYFGSCS